MEQKPSIGCVVHYVSYGTPGGEFSSACRAAIVTEVKGHAVSPADLKETDEHVVGLCVLNPEGMFFNRDVVQMEHARNGGTWHWPEQL